MSQAGCNCNLTLYFCLYFIIEDETLLTQYYYVQVTKKAKQKKRQEERERKKRQKHYCGKVPRVKTEVKMKKAVQMLPQ